MTRRSHPRRMSSRTSSWIIMVKMIRITSSMFSIDLMRQFYRFFFQGLATQKLRAVSDGMYSSIYSHRV